MEKPPEEEADKVENTPKPPRNKRLFDLSTIPYESDDPPDMRPVPSAYRSPAQMMRDMGFAPDKNMTPLQFLIAVMNDRADLLYKQEKKRNMMEGKGIGLKYRIECAKTAAKYMHMQMPSVQISEDASGQFAENLAKSVARGEERVRTRQMIIETVERVSPDLPLEKPSYPPAFSDIEGKSERIDNAED